MDMYPRILAALCDCVRERKYVMTLHAEEEMCNDRLTVHDVERGILTGTIMERQADAVTGEWKYRVRGEACGGHDIEVVAKLSPTGKMVIITVYLE